MIKDRPNLSIEHKRATFVDKLECVGHTDLKAKWIQHTKGHWLCYVCAGDKKHGPVHVTETAAIPDSYARVNAMQLVLAFADKTRKSGRYGVGDASLIYELSTAHITEDDNHMLTKFHKKSDFPLVVYPHDCGYFVYVNYGPDTDLQDVLKQCKEYGFSDSLCDLLAFTAKLGAKWLNLDCDADDLDNDILELHDW